MEKKKKIINIFKYIFLGFAVCIYGFIFYQSGLKPSNSRKWNDWAQDIWAGFINDTLGIKEDVVITKPEKIEFNTKEWFSEDVYNSNGIDGYDEHEIPFSCEKFLIVDVFPKAVTDKSYSLIASPSNKVNLVQSGNRVVIEALELGDVKIKAISNVDNNITAEYDFSIVERRAPADFTLCNQVDNDFISLKVGESTTVLYWYDFISDEMYYDYSKLAITSSDESVGIIRGEYFKALGPGTATVTVSNGTKSKSLNIEVKENSDTISHVTGINVTGDSTVHIRDLSNEKYVQLNANFETDNGSSPTDSNVIWSVDNSLAAYVFSNGRVYGNKDISDDNVSFTVRATSVDNPSVYKDFNMTLSHVTPTSISLESSMTSEGIYSIAANGKSQYVRVECEPNNVDRFNYDVIVGDSSIIKADIEGNRINVVGLKEGKSTLYVVSKDDPNLVSNTLNIEVRTRGYINDDNIENFSRVIRKYLSGHAFLFMLGTVFMSLYVFFAHFDKKRLVKLLSLASVLLVGLIIGMISELIETMVPGRAPSWSDVFIDLIGTSIGFFFVFLYVGIREIVLYKKNKKENANEESVEM